MFRIRILMPFAVLVIAATSATAGPVEISWVPSNDFGNVAMTVVTNGNNTTYEANGLGIEVFYINGDPMPPRLEDTYSFAFNTSSFAVVENKTYEAANNSSTAEDIMSTTIGNVEASAPNADGIISVTFETTYNAQALPQDYQNFLGSTTAIGFFTVDYDPTDETTPNLITDVSITIESVPEPSTLVLAALGVLAIPAFRRWCV